MEIDKTNKYNLKVGDLVRGYTPGIWKLLEISDIIPPNYGDHPGHRMVKAEKLLNEDLSLPKVKKKKPGEWGMDWCHPVTKKLLEDEHKEATKRHKAALKLLFGD